jgi:hypothetical protein
MDDEKKPQDKTLTGEMRFINRVAGDTLASLVT